MALTTINEWTDPTIIVTNDPMSAALFNTALMQNMLYLKTPNFDQYLSDADAAWNTTSTTPVEIDSGVMRVEVDIVTGAVEIWGNIVIQNNSSGNTIYVGVEIDDDYMLGDVAGGTKTLYVASNRMVINSDQDTFNFTAKLFGLSVGTHSANPMMWQSGGTGTWHGELLNEFGIREIK